MMINVNRKIFNTLNKSNTDLVFEYIKNIVLQEDKDKLLTGSDLSLVSTGITEVITKNEALINRFGIERYKQEDYSAEFHVSGYWYRTGTIVVCPFDWSLDNNNDFEYSFVLARTL